jgi:periplasmic protein TonB
MPGSRRPRLDAGFAWSLLPVAAVIGCADAPPPPRGPVVEETVAYEPWAAPAVIQHTTTITTETAPAAPAASAEPAPPRPPQAPSPEPFVHPPVRVLGRWVLQFQPGMTRPTKVSGRDPRTTTSLGDERVVFVQGIVEVDGRFTQPRIIRGVRSVDDDVLSAVATWRVTPIVFRGKPTAVLYTLPITVQGP